MTARNPFDIINSQSDDVADFQASVIDINARTANGNTLLMRAVGENCCKIAKFLLEAKADASATSGGLTALHRAAFSGRIELIKPLLEAKCGIDTRSKLENTALMLACDWGYSDFVRMLLEAKANTALKNKLGHTALDLSRASSKSRNLLLQAGLPNPPEAPPAPRPANLSFVERV